MVSLNVQPWLDCLNTISDGDDDNDDDNDDDDDDGCKEVEVDDEGTDIEESE